MKIKVIIFLSLSLLILYSNNVKPENFQLVDTLDNELQSISTNPFVPIRFTADGLNSFFENIYNQHGYGQEFLPNNFSHMIQFLQFGKRTHQKRPYLKSVLKLFGNKLKAASYVNCYAFLELIEYMPDLLQHYFVIPESHIFAYNKKMVHNVLYSNFLSGFSQFKQNPDQFLSDVSEHVLKEIHKQAVFTRQHISVEQLRQSLVRFLEVSIGKLIWSPKDHEGIWDLFCATAKQIENFTKNQIITDIDNLDDIYWTFIHRFCFFLDISAQDLPIHFFEDFRSSMATCSLTLFKIEEQEKCMKTKAMHLIHALFESEAKARAYKNGILLG